MVSTDAKAVDPLLRLLNKDGKQLAEDDDGGGFPNARIIFKVERAETYGVVATCFGQGKGAFTLTVREAAANSRSKR
jgi:hypothetical protein